MRKRLVIALAVAGLLSVGFGASILPASADPRTVVVTLASGEQRTVTVDVAPGTDLSTLQIPGITEPIVAVSDVTPAGGPASSGQTTPAATTTTTPAVAAPTETAATAAPPAAAPGPATATATAPAPAAAAPAPAASSAQDADAAARAARKATEHKAARRRAAEKAAARKPAAVRSERQPSTKTTDEKPHAEVEAGDAPAATPAPAPATTPASTATPAAGSAAVPAGTILGTGPTAVGVPNFFIDRFRIPPFLLPIYQAAGIQYGVRWEVLAAINEIESDYGRNLNVSTAGALGWMQFMPATWKTYGVDANDDGTRDPFNPVDAIFAAARYLKAAGAAQDLRTAVFAYNHAGWYVDDVLGRAQVIAGMPVDLVSSLTGLTQGHFPVAAKATYAGQVTARDAQRTVPGGQNAAQPVESSATRRGIDIRARDGAAITAVQDGTIVARGRTRRLGTYLKLRDAYGNTYTYGHLQDVVSRVPVAKPSRQSSASVARELKLPAADPKPTRAATAGRQRSSSAPHRSAASTAARAKAAKERLFANPRRPGAWSAGGRTQVQDAATSLPADATMARLFTVDIGLDRKDVVLKPLVVGRRVIAGTILGRLAPTRAGRPAHLHFEIRPAGRGAPRIDPKPILDGWKLLESTAVYRAGSKAFMSSAAGAHDPTVGQMLLMTKEDLARRVLADARITLYSCGRRDIEAGIVDRRILATLLFLASNGLDPTVSSLRCGHGYLTTSGNVSEHSSGSAVDIAAVNGTPIAGHQGAGSITDVTIRRLLTLQGAMQPHQIISLMTYPNAPNTLALPDHADHIHVGFRPEYDPSSAGAKDLDSALKPGQWAKLIDRLGSIDNPKVSPSPSRYALPTARDER